LNINKEIKSNNIFTIIDEVKSQGGYLVLPHPFKNHTNINELAHYVDFIEVWNSRCSPLENNKAIFLCEKFNKRYLLGSDAHTFFEIGNVQFSYDCDQKKVINIKKFKYASRYSIKQSQLIFKIKKYFKYFDNI